MAARPGSGTAARRGRGVGSEADCLLGERAPCSSGRRDAEGPLRFHGRELGLAEAGAPLGLRESFRFSVPFGKIFCKCGVV